MFVGVLSNSSPKCSNASPTQCRIETVDKRHAHAEAHADIERLIRARLLPPGVYWIKEDLSVERSLITRIYFLEKNATAGEGSKGRLVGEGTTWQEALAESKHWAGGRRPA